jgi:hypothetical protein
VHQRSIHAENAAFFRASRRWKALPLADASGFSQKLTASVFRVDSWKERFFLRALTLPAPFDGDWLLERRCNGSGGLARRIGLLVRGWAG